ncbi:MAG TPA: alginate lyase family protein [Candidatus Hydrogenedentes bacterium]|nr:alginate lyase family protein [Candidatus Hydrogenedentota bacterium]
MTWLALICCVCASEDIVIRPGPAFMDVSKLVQLEQAVDIMAEARFDFPKESSILWRDDDELPAPEDSKFSRRVAEFIARFPQPAHDYTGPTPWDVGATASRQCKALAYLASGSDQGRRNVARLCVIQNLRLQWLFPIEIDAVDESFYAGAASMGLTGALLWQGAPEYSALREFAATCLRIGAAQLALRAGDGPPELEGAANALMKAARRVPASLLTLTVSEEDFFSQLNLDHPDMAEVSPLVRARKFEEAREAYTAMLARRFRAPHAWPDLLLDKTVDLSSADRLCLGVFDARARLFDHSPGEDTPGSHYWMWTLLNAYRASGEERYVEHLCRLFNAWYSANPATLTWAKPGWEVIDAGCRAGQSFPPVLATLANHPTFRTEALFNMARSMLDHAKYIEVFASSAGSGLVVESSALACVALLFPEFASADAFYRAGVNRLQRSGNQCFLADGFQSSCSPHYHLLTLWGLGNVVSLAARQSWPLDESVTRTYSKAVETLMYMVYPDGSVPFINDSTPFRLPTAGVFKTAAGVLSHDGFRWFATGGAEGASPESLGRNLAASGFCAMRDRWEPSGQVIVFDAGYFGAAHQHEDKLSFVYYAEGRELIGDVGSYGNVRDPWEPYWRGSWGHNTIVIDGLGQARELAAPEAIPDLDRRFVVGPGFQYAEGWFRGPYSAGGLGASRVAGEPEFEHQRCLFYVLGEYLIVCDRVLGAGRHDVELIFHISPIAEGAGAETVKRSVDLQVREDGVVVTREVSAGNVALLPLEGARFELHDYIGQERPVRGWYALEGKVPSHDVVYACDTDLPSTFATVIQPLAPGRTDDVRIVEPEVVRVSGSQACVAFWHGNDLFLLSYEGPAEMTCGPIHFKGTALLLRCDSGRRPRQALALDATRLDVSGASMLKSDRPSGAQAIDFPE